MDTPVAVKNSPVGHLRSVPLAQYRSEHPIDTVFPATSERAAKIAMLIMFGLMAVTVVLLALDEVGFLG